MLVFAVAAVLAGLTNGAGAQDRAPAQAPAIDTARIERGKAVYQKARCAGCHGWAANGEETGPVPPGPSLRRSQLDLAAVRETIQCGRPNTDMPFHERLAYTDTRCYGVTAADLGTSKPQPGAFLQAAELDDLASYIVGYVEGRGKATVQECEDYYGPGSAVCAQYK